MNYICNCTKSDFSKHNYTYWEDRNTTSDEIEIIDFLENSYKLESKKITLSQRFDMLISFTSGI